MCGYFDSVQKCNNSNWYIKYLISPYVITMYGPFCVTICRASYEGNWKSEDLHSFPTHLIKNAGIATFQPEKLLGRSKLPFIFLHLIPLRKDSPKMVDWNCDPGTYVLTGSAAWERR